MIFGFFKHAPADLALVPWLSEVLKETIEAESLSEGAFWPSLVDGGRRVVPDLCFEVRAASGPRIVVVEAKRSTERHTFHQLLLETRAAAVAYPGKPIVIVTVGSHSEQRNRTDELMNELDGFDVHHRHSSWALLGRTINRVTDPNWRQYASDISARMRSLGLLNEPGLPDLAVDPRVAIEAVNRLSIAARDFLKLVNETIAEPSGSQLESGRIWRTGTADKPNSSIAFWTQGVVYASWRRPGWPEPRRVFVALDLVMVGGPTLLVGPAWAAKGRLTQLMVDGEADFLVRNRDLNRYAVSFAERRAHRGKVRVRDFRFNVRPWSPEVGIRNDIAWVGDQFQLAADVAAKVEGELGSAWVSARGSGDEE